MRTHQLRARHTTRGEVNGEACERGKAAEQSRRNEDAVVRRRQRIMLSRWVHQGVDIAPYWREKTHSPCLHVLMEQTRPRSPQTLGLSRLSER